jgi:hypothetical protein
MSKGTPCSLIRVPAGYNNRFSETPTHKGRLAVAISSTLGLLLGQSDSSLVGQVRLRPRCLPTCHYDPLPLGSYVPTV